jgi:hypothetical protein
MRKFAGQFGGTCDVVIVIGLSPRTGVASFAAPFLNPNAGKNARERMA